MIIFRVGASCSLKVRKQTLNKAISTCLLKVNFLDDTFGLECVEDHQSHPESVLGDVLVPAETEQDMNSFFVKFSSDFGLQDFRLEMCVRSAV